MYFKALIYGRKKQTNIVLDLLVYQIFFFEMKVSFIVDLDRYFIYRIFPFFLVRKKNEEMRKNTLM